MKKSYVKCILDGRRLCENGRPVCCWRNGKYLVLESLILLYDVHSLSDNTDQLAACGSIGCVQ